MKAYSGDDDRAVVPNGVRYIGPYLSAYEGIASLSLPEGLLSVGEGAFSDCTKLKKIEIPGDLRETERGAFRACHPDLTICAPAGGEAQRYAGEYGFRFEAIGQAASGTR